MKMMEFGLFFSNQGVKRQVPWNDLTAKENASNTNIFFENEIRLRVINNAAMIITLRWKTFL